MPSSSDLIGKTFGQYEILKWISYNGLATVYTARHLATDQRVAIKLLPPEFLRDAHFFPRVERELDIANRLFRHPHIAPIHEFGIADDTPYLVMPLMHSNLGQFMQRGQPPLAALERPFTQIAQALAHAHNQGGIHRALKPSNILLDEQDNAYVADFASPVIYAHLIAYQAGGYTSYVSPEQLTMQPLNARSDIYVLGVILFELITGHKLFTTGDVLSLVIKYLNEPLPPLSDFRADILPSLQAVIDKATAKDPAARYVSVLEMAQAFTAALPT